MQDAKRLGLMGMGLSALCMAGPAMGTTVFSNDYSDASQAANYATDRANPGGFTVNDSGDGELKLSVLAADASGQTSSFYNFHGVQTGPAGNFNAGRVAEVSVDIYVPSAWDGSTAKRGGDLWVRLDNPATTIGNDYYPTIGVYNYGSGGGALVSMFSPTASGIDQDNTPGDPFYDRDDLTINFDDWNTLGFRFTVTGLEYLFNGDVVATDTDPGYSVVPDIDQAYLQGWQDDLNNEDYIVRFDNLIVTPEPASLTLLGLGGLAIVSRRHRR